MKSRHELRREIVERATALTAQQLQRQQQRSEQQQQRRTTLASPQRLTGSFAAGLALGLIALRRHSHKQREERAAPAEPQTRSSLLARTARELLPVVQPLLLTVAAQWWQQRQASDDDDTPSEPPEPLPPEMIHI